MKWELPPNHGLVDIVVASDHVTRGGQISLTDVQYAALEAGVAKGQSLLVVAPTSSGKTGVGILGLSGWLNNRRFGTSKIVYLVSHRALARQKFEDFASAVMPLHGIQLGALVLATGDGVVSASGDPVEDALAATILVATYEKYLGLVSSAGLTTDMSHICFVCDELQLLTDGSRGADVEMLLTLLKRAKFGQFIGLSAVLERASAQHIADWLEVQLLRTEVREVPLDYELRTPNQTLSVSTTTPDRVSTGPAKAAQTLQVLRELHIDEESHLPVVVFCTRRRDVFDLASAWAQERGAATTGEVIVFDELTTSSNDLVRFIPAGFAFHTADLVDDERDEVERRLKDNRLKVVFATTTLAFGLNFSFQTVVLHSWQRWNSERRQYEPIASAEFHNMAGRAGRLGYAQNGRVVYFASHELTRSASEYLRFDHAEPIKTQIDPRRFDQIALQLFGAGLVSDVEGLLAFLSDTLSAFVERESTRNFDAMYRHRVEAAVSALKAWGFIQ